MPCRMGTFCRLGPEQLVSGAQIVKYSRMRKKIILEGLTCALEGWVRSASATQLWQCINRVASEPKKKPPRVDREEALTKK